MGLTSSLLKIIAPMPSCLLLEVSSTTNMLKDTQEHDTMAELSKLISWRLFASKEH